MKRLITALYLLAVLSLPVLGGEVSTPGVVNPPPPPCAENCTTTTTNSTLNAITLDLAWLVLGIVVP